MRFTPLLSLVVLLAGSMALAEDAKELAEKVTAKGAANLALARLRFWRIRTWMRRRCIL